MYGLTEKIWPRGAELVKIFLKCLYGMIKVLCDATIYCTKNTK